MRADRRPLLSCELFRVALAAKRGVDIKMTMSYANSGHRPIFIDLYLRTSTYILSCLLGLQSAGKILQVFNIPPGHFFNIAADNC